MQRLGSGTCSKFVHQSIHVANMKFYVNNLHDASNRASDRSTGEWTRGIESRGWFSSFRAALYRLA